MTLLKRVARAAFQRVMQNDEIKNLLNKIRANIRIYVKSKAKNKIKKIETK